MGECASCGDTRHETAWCDALDAEICLRCYEHESGRRPVVRDHLHGCPVCGDRVAAADGHSGRYGEEGICWPCFVKRHPETDKRPRRKQRGEFERLFLKVWDLMEADGYAATTGDGPVVIVGYCPRCDQTMAARFLDHPVAVKFECRGPCSPEQIMERLGKRRAHAA